MTQKERIKKANKIALEKLTKEKRQKIEKEYVYTYYDDDYIYFY
jgi:hypothetical protein